jgi:hypothetical protein
MVDTPGSTEHGSNPSRQQRQQERGAMIYLETIYALERVMGGLEAADTTLSSARTTFAQTGSSVASVASALEQANTLIDTTIAATGSARDELEELERQRHERARVQHSNDDRGGSLRAPLQPAP